MAKDLGSEEPGQGSLHLPVFCSLFRLRRSLSFHGNTSCPSLWRIWNSFLNCLSTNTLMLPVISGGSSRTKETPFCFARSQSDNPSSHSPHSCRLRSKEPERDEVEVKPPHNAGKATQRARPTDLESAACKRHCQSREHCPSGLAGRQKALKIRQGMNPYSMTAH